MRNGPAKRTVLSHLVSDRAVLQRISYGDRIADVGGRDNHSTANDFYIRRVEFTISCADCELAKQLAIAQRNPSAHLLRYAITICNHQRSCYFRSVRACSTSEFETSLAILVISPLGCMLL